MASEYLVELYFPRGSAAAPDGLTAGEPQARYLRSFVVPEDETCYLLYEAESAAAVREAAERAGLQFERIVQVAPERRFA